MDSELKVVIDILQTDLKQIYGMRVEDIAYVLGINRRTYYNWRNGNKNYQKRLINELRDLTEICKGE